MALSREVINLKDGMAVFNPLIPGVIEQAKGMFMQQNPMLQKPLNDVGADLRKELEPRRAEIVEILARVYAQRFTEAELKEIVAFYKTPAGKKMLAQEPNAIDAAFTEVQTWAQNLEQQVISRVRAEMKKKGHDL
jgi:hypothetical protein